MEAPIGERVAQQYSTYDQQTAAAAARNTTTQHDNQQQQQPGKLAATPASSGKGKISQRSQSSPSSLTTHKFGLRPTPSPPRLIIDHQTGDIVESYPDQPVYLRTYQPLDQQPVGIALTTDNDDDDGDQHYHHHHLHLHQDHHRDHSPLAQPYPASDYQRRLLDQYLLQAAGGSAQVEPYDEIGLDDQDDDHQLIAMSGQAQQRFRPVIPPPHSTTGRAYAAGQQQPVPGADQQVAGFSGSHNSSFKRALNKLHEQPDGIGKTDIALLASAPQQTGAPGGEQSRPKVRITSAAKGNALLAARSTPAPGSATVAAAAGKQQVAPQTRRRKEARADIDDFPLYDLCYNFRILLVLLLSSLLIYLLLGPLEPTCTLFRPTYTYVSLIVASVNLTCVFVFSLFWYCSSVTRTLYANLSSSAFIVSIYSILVAVNLAIGILFFFINTCHFQRLVKTQAGAGGALQLNPQPAAAALLAANPNLIDLGAHSITTRHLSTSRQQLALLPREPHSEWAWRARRQLPDEVSESPAGDSPPPSDSEEPEVGGGAADFLPSTTAAAPPETTTSPGQISDNQQQQHYAMSPIEAAWEYLVGQVRLARRKFHRFLLHYDLRFVGTLHALCAVCLQYLAMRVAVVRSHFCSPPVGAYL